MDKIRIKGLKQGTKKLEDGSYAIGFVSNYGTTWVVAKMFYKLFSQCPALEKLIKTGWDEGIAEEDFIGRYLYVTNKQQEIKRDGQITTFPLL